MSNRNNIGHPRCKATYPPAGACGKLRVRCKKKALPRRNYCRDCDPKRADANYVALMAARANRAVRPSKKERRRLEKRRAALSA